MRPGNTIYLNYSMGIYEVTALTTGLYKNETHKKIYK